MAEIDDEEDEDELPSVEQGPLNEGPWEKAWLLGALCTQIVRRLVKRKFRVKTIWAVSYPLLLKREMIEKNCKK